jgi:hypothetical protein
MRFTWWKSGSWNTICDVCGSKFKAEDLKQRWDGLMVCKDDWEIRHPQELIRPIQDQAKLPWTRPEATDTFVGPTYTLNTSGCTPFGMSCQAGYGSAGCAICDNVIDALLP